MMKMNALFFKIFFLGISLFCISIKSQKSTSYLAYYEFGFCDSPQTMVLSQNIVGKYSGFIDISLEKEKRMRYKNVKIRTELLSEQVKTIITKLKMAEIDLVNDNFDDDELKYLDGDGLNIKLLRNSKIDSYAFDEIYPLSKTKIEVTPLRIKIQNWLTIIDDEVHLAKQLSKVKKDLPKGQYCYFSGITNVCFKKK
ncbi:hypothetical protein [Chryseobacterium sp. M5A1_1a]